MSPSLADIPSHLLQPHAKARFILWIRTLPIDIPTKRTLLRLWSRQTQTRLTPEDYNAALLR